MSESVATRASAIIAFRASNVRSFGGRLELSLEATALAEPGIVRRMAAQEDGKPVEMLPVAGLFGPNASGKSNVLRALDDMQRLVLTSFSRGTQDTGVPRRAFRLGTTDQNGTEFEIELILDGIRHIYGFVVDDEQILEEWAYRFPKGRRAILFERRGMSVRSGATTTTETKSTAKILRKNALFLSTAASTNHSGLVPLFEWFGRNILLVSGTRGNWGHSYTAWLVEHEMHRPVIEMLLNAADLGIVRTQTHKMDVKLRERVARALQIVAQSEEGDAKESDLEELPFEGWEIGLVHKGAREDVEFALDEESFGTQVWLSLLGPVVTALAEGKVLLVDELDASLHSALVSQLVQLFQDPETNPRRAQLIFSTHDTTLLDEPESGRLLGRDQVWFTEKDDDGCSRLYPLTDLSPRKHEAVSRRYLGGRYGAVPIVSHHEFRQIAEMIGSQAE